MQIRATTQQNQGYVAISVVLITMAVILVIVVTVSQLGIGEAQSSFSVTRGEGSLHLSEGCMEDALLKLRASSSYAGGSITRPEGTCTITATNSASVYTITATSTLSNYTRSVQSVVTRGASAITITSWKEL